jgi:hypothetical protein
MKVSTKSDSPQMRSAAVPHTSATLTVSKARNSAEQELRDQELEFLSLLVRALNPQIRLKRVNDALRAIVGPDTQAELFPAGAEAGSKRP